VRGNCVLELPHQRHGVLDEDYIQDAEGRRDLDRPEHLQLQPQPGHDELPRVREHAGQEPVQAARQGLIQRLLVL